MFGSKSQFYDLCYEIVTKLKDKYPHIKRIYVRAEFPHIDDNYRKFLLQSFEGTYYPQKIINAGKAVYAERICEMIDKSDYCVVYLDEGYISRNTKSGTKFAYDHAVKRGLKIVRCSSNTKDGFEILI